MYAFRASMNPCRGTGDGPACGETKAPGAQCCPLASSFIRPPRTPVLSRTAARAVSRTRMFCRRAVPNNRCRSVPGAAEKTCQPHQVSRGMPQMQRKPQRPTMFQRSAKRVFTGMPAALLVVLGAPASGAGGNREAWRAARAAMAVRRQSANKRARAQRRQATPPLVGMRAMQPYHVPRCVWGRAWRGVRTMMTALPAERVSCCRRCRHVQWHHYVICVDIPFIRRMFGGALAGMSQGAATAAPKMIDA